jgi:hypothetical protein
MANVFSQSSTLYLGIALMAQSPILIPNEPGIGQFLRAKFATEALWMPAGRHCLDHSTNDEFATLVAAWREQNMKVTFAVFATLELIEDAILEISEALGASEQYSKYENLTINTNRRHDWMLTRSTVCATTAHSS